MAKNKMYRAWAGDSRMYSQFKVLPATTYTQCVKCHEWIKDGTQKMVDLKCEACQKKGN